MDQKIRRVHAPAFKAKVAVEALKEQKTIAELSSIYSIHTTQITKKTVAYYQKEYRQGY